MSVSHSPSSQRPAEVISVDFASGKVVDRFRPQGMAGEVKPLSGMILGLHELHDLAMKDEYLRRTQVPYAFQPLIFRNVITLLEAIRREYGDFRVCLVRGHGVTRVFPHKGKGNGHDR